MQGLRLFIFACGLLSLVGCTNGQPGKQNTPQTTQTTTATASTFLDHFIDSLLVEYPNALNNDVTRLALADTIKSRMGVFCGSELPFLSECPVVFYHSELFPPHTFESFDFAPDKNADKVLVQFVYQDISQSRAIAFSILTALTKEAASTLIDEHKYFVKGKFLFFPGNTHDCVFYLPDRKLAQNTTCVSTQSGLPLFMIGNFIMDDVSFTPAE